MAANRKVVLETCRVVWTHSILVANMACMLVLLSQQNLFSIAIVGDEYMKLGRCVVGTQMPIKFEDGFRTNTTRSAIDTSRLF